MAETLLWYEKYRPQSISDYIWKDDDLKDKISAWIANPAEMPNFIITGPSGVGKTTLCKVIKNELQLEREDFLFLNASVDNSVETIRETVVNFCAMSGWGKFELKIVVFDEAERLSKAAQLMLRGIMETNTHVRFFFTCNDPHGLKEALKSRARVIVLDSLDQETFVGRLLAICEQENINLENEQSANTISQIIDQHYPDLRKSIDLLQDSVRETVDGRVLVSNDAEKSTGVNTRDGIIDFFTSGDIAALRTIVTNFAPAEIRDVFDWMISSTDMFGRREKEAVIVIADHAYRNDIVSKPDINLLAMLVKLHLLQNMENE